MEEGRRKRIGSRQRPPQLNSHSWNVGTNPCAFPEEISDSYLRATAHNPCLVPYRKPHGHKIKVRIVLRPQDTYPVWLWVGLWDIKGAVDVNYTKQASSAVFASLVYPWIVANTAQPATQQQHHIPVLEGWTFLTGIVHRQKSNLMKQMTEFYQHSLSSVAAP